MRSALPRLTLPSPITPSSTSSLWHLSHYSHVWIICGASSSSRTHSWENAPLCPTFASLFFQAVSPPPPHRSSVSHLHTPLILVTHLCCSQWMEPPHPPITSPIHHIITLNRSPPRAPSVSLWPWLCSLLSRFWICSRSYPQQAYSGLLVDQEKKRENERTRRQSEVRKIKTDSWAKDTFAQGRALWGEREKERQTIRKEKRHLTQSWRALAVHCTASRRKTSPLLLK